MKSNFKYIFHFKLEVNYFLNSLPISHGATRRGALVFDLADLVKDACIMPYAFIASDRGNDLSSFRKDCILSLESMDALTIMFEEIKSITEYWNREAGG